MPVAARPRASVPSSSLMPSVWVWVGQGEVTREKEAGGSGWLMVVWKEHGLWGTREVLPAHGCLGELGRPPSQGSATSEGHSEVLQGSARTRLRRMC